jgi:regulatory protein
MENISRIISIRPEAGEGLRRIELSDGSVFSFGIHYLPPVCADESITGPDAPPDVQISAAQEEGFRFASSCLRAEKTALQLIARAEQSVFGIRRKLEKRGHDSGCVQAVIARLCELGFLDDRRYAALWLESRICRQASSPFRLLAALASRGIEQDVIKQALKEALDEETELQLLKHFAEKLLRKQKNNDQDSHAGCHSIRWQLKNEGFSSLAIQNFLEE